jgi:hypothetical protein
MAPNGDGTRFMVNGGCADFMQIHLHHALDGASARSRPRVCGVMWQILFA